MAKVHHVKSARKDNPVANKGESYYWWKHKFGRKQFSKTRPRASQLTQSGLLSDFYALQESIEDGLFDSWDDMEANKEEVENRLNEMLDECQERLDNMPEQLQETSNAGRILQERIDELENSISEIESIEVPVDPDDWTEELDEDEWKEANKEEKEEMKNQWRIDKQSEFIQEINDIFPQF